MWFINIIYYGIGAILLLVALYIGFRADIAIKKMAVKEAIKELQQETPRKIEVCGGMF